jgi:NADH:ubiquinone oxidoreductase subunit F (NADH-binding)
MTGVLDPKRQLLGGGPLLSSAFPDLATHQRRLGPVPWQGGPARLIGAVETSGLTGRGGAAFPTWRKLATVILGDRPVVVANAAEGEPASAKDRTLLLHGPHLVLDGLQLAAEAVGAATAYLYVAAGPAADSARRAIAERAERAGWDRLPVTVVVAPDTFIAGEESAVVAAIEGRPARPKDRTVLVSERGVRGRPTLVQNVETLAQLALLARHGPAWFRQRGTHTEPGTFLATVAGSVAAPGVYEVPHGIPFGSLVGRAGGPVGTPSAVLVGGYHGRWLPFAAELPISAPGAGVVAVLSTADCGLVETARIAGYLAGQSARQCGPCLNGLPRLAETLHRLAHGDGRPELVARVHRLTALTDGRGACRHPDGTVRMVRSALHVFAEEVDRHLAGRCGAVPCGAVPCGAAREGIR